MTYTKFTYDNLDRISFVEFDNNGDNCGPLIAELIWEDDSVRRIIYPGNSCGRYRPPLTVSYANNLVVKIGTDYEFSYNNDASLSEVIHVFSNDTIQYNFQYNFQYIQIEMFNLNQ